MNTANANASETTTGRNEKGQFVPGNPGGPGNPFARQVAALRKALVSAVTPEDFANLARSLLARAMEGDMQAAKLLLTYAIGKPEASPQPDRMDAHEWAIYRETTPMKTESAELIQAGEPELHLRCVRVTRPILTQMMQNQLADAFNESPEQRVKREAAEAAEAERRMNAAAREWDFPNAGPSPNRGDGGKPPSGNGKKRPAPAGNGGLPPSGNGGIGNEPEA